LVLIIHIIKNYQIIVLV